LLQRLSATSRLLWWALQCLPNQCLVRRMAGLQVQVSKGGGTTDNTFTGLLWCSQQQQ
jgi:hypothetical protein